MARRIQEIISRLRGAAPEEEIDLAIERLTRIVATEARRAVRLTPLTER